MNTKILKFSTFAIIAILAFACKKYDVMQPNDKTPIQPTHSIEQLINEFGTQNGVMFPIRPNSGTAGLYSVDFIPLKDDAINIYRFYVDVTQNNGVVKQEIRTSQKSDIPPLASNEKLTKKDTIVISPYNSDIIIVGRVISDDAQGNYYKSIAIQDLQNPAWNIKISINAAGIGAWYPLGSVVSIRCNGLAIGKYADMFQLGVVYFNNNSDSNKRGYEPGRMPMPLFKSITEVYDIADKNVVVDTLTIKQILDLARIKGENTVVIHNDRQIHSRLVCIKNAYFNQKAQGTAIPNAREPDKTFAPSTDGIGFPRSRDIEDGTDWVSVATSEYSRFSNVLIPTEEYVGTVTAIVSWYEDKDDRYAGNVQLTIRSLDDLNLYNSKGEKWQP